jgi:hypothetical protein
VDGLVTGPATTLSSGFRLLWRGLCIHDCRQKF